MLNTFFHQPGLYFCLAIAVFGFAICISSEDSFIKKQLRLAFNQTGNAKILIPLFSSLGVSFVLTILLKFVS